jgi:hypothetical protein
VPPCNYCGGPRRLSTTENVLARLLQLTSLALTILASVGFALTLHRGAGGFMLALTLLGALGCTVAPALVTFSRRSVWVCPKCRTAELVPKKTEAPK